MPSKEAFEEWYTELRKQQPVTSYALNVPMARLILEMRRDSSEEMIQAIAKGNDVPSLKVLLALDDGQALKNCFTKDRIGPIAFAVAHMLVDNSGNEAFARQWVEQLGHDLKIAADIYKKGARKNPESIVLEQHRVGMAILCKALELNTDAPYKECPLIGVVQSIGVGTEKPMRERLCNEVAAYLRITSPDEIPIISRRDGDRVISMALDRAMWKIEDAAPVLPAFGLAYSADNAHVRGQMHAGIKEALKFGSEVFLEPDSAFSHHWDVMLQWKDENLMELLWKGRFRDSDPTKGQRSASFLTALSKTSYHVAVDVASEMHDMGLDLNRLSEEFSGDRKYGRRLIDVAAQVTNPHLFGWLLAKGCDPDIKNQEESLDRYPPQSASEFIDGWTDLVALGDREASKRTALTDMENLLRTWRAKQSALLALQEMDVMIGPRP